MRPTTWKEHVDKEVVNLIADTQEAESEEGTRDFCDLQGHTCTDLIPPTIPCLPKSSGPSTLAVPAEKQLFKKCESIGTIQIHTTTEDLHVE